MIAEFLGTMILILFGIGVVAQVVAGGSSLGDHDSISWAWGFGVVLGVYTAARISGGHLNPAVTIALAAFRGFPWKKVVPYIIAQVAGAFVGALLVRWAYNSVLHNFDPGLTAKSQTIFSTLPGNGTLPVSLWGGFLDQVIGTAILVFLIFVLTDRLNDPPLSNLTPFIVGLVVVAIGMAWGTNAGYAINPARDLGPRLASYITGYGTAWRDQYNQLYWWVPIAAPIIGGLIGGLIYVTMIGRVLPFLQGTQTPAGRGGEIETPAEYETGEAQTDTPRGQRGAIEPTQGYDATGEAQTDTPRGQRGPIDPTRGPRMDPGTGRDPRDPGSGPIDPGPGPNR
jgi:glycerol uptake facilitator protein